MLGALRRSAKEASRASGRASQLQQQRFLNIHEYQVLQTSQFPPQSQCATDFGLTYRSHKLFLQGAELMGKHGINAPPGIAVSKIEDLMPAAKKMADSDGEVCQASESSNSNLLACMQLATSTP